MSRFHTKRVYASPEPDDGRRVLVDRLWPRGLSKDKAALDDWFKDLAPSDELRHWFGHKPERWPEFKKRYAAELGKHSELVENLRTMAKRKRVTLLFGAKDEAHNNAVALKAYLEKE